MCASCRSELGTVGVVTTRNDRLNRQGEAALEPEADTLEAPPQRRRRNKTGGM
jgi:hypothetical protein